MKTSMVAQDAETFVALGRAMALATAEGVLDPQSSTDLAAALVTGILTGFMEFETYAQVHDTLARVLERAFERPAPTPSAEVGPSEGAEEPLGVYLEVVGDAWDKVSWEPEACGRLKTFVDRVFALDRSRFGGEGWFRAPLKSGPQDLLRYAKAAGLQVLSLRGALPQGLTEAVLGAPESPAGEARVLLGWGDRQTALDLRSLSPT